MTKKDIKDKKEIEPYEYFADLKTKCSKLSLKKVDKDLKKIANLIEEAKILGQKKLAEDYKAVGISYIRERIMFNNGIKTYIKQNDIETYIRNVKGHITKICELENFARPLPKKVKDEILRVKKLKLFDDLFVLFNEFEQKENLTKEEKRLRSKNRDPILFGTIDESMDRFYFIIDWEDDVCDLTLSKFVNEVNKIKNGYAPGEIIEDADVYFNNLMKEKYKAAPVTDKIKNLFRNVLSFWK